MNFVRRLKRIVSPLRAQASFETHKDVRETLRLLRPCRAKGFDKIRLGGPNDGGYVLLDDFRNLDTALSLGVERDASWDVSVADRGLTVYQFDHTIKAPPVVDERLIWSKRKISAQADAESESLVSLLEKYDRGNDTPNILLKMDIEHDEWPVFDALPDRALGRFSQIICELHGLDFLAERPRREQSRRVLEKLNSAYAVIHVHANNYCGFNDIAGVTTPAIVEATFASRSLYKFEETDELFPGPLDQPCDPWTPDLYLGSFRY